MSDKDKTIKKTQAQNDVEVIQTPEQLSPGAQLKNARQRLGLSQAQIADKLHLRVLSVEAIEQDLAEPGVSVTFSKGYVRLYARLVDLEAQPLLLAYDQLHCSDNQPAKLQSFSKRVAREADDHKWNMVTIVVVLLVFGSVIGWWVQQSDSLTTSQSFVSDTFDSVFSESEQAKRALDASNAALAQDKSENAEGLSAFNQDRERLNTGPEIPEDEVSNIASNIGLDSDEASLLNGALLPTDTELTNDDSIVEEALSAAVDPLQEVITRANVAAETSPTPVNDQQAPVSASTREIDNVIANDDGSVSMAFTFAKDCWVSVKDKNDEIVAIGVKAQGRVMQVSGLAPFDIILCSPENVQLNVGGQNIDLSIYPMGRAANFSLTLRD